MATFYRGYISNALSKLSFSSAPGVWTLHDLLQYIEEYGSPAYLGTYHFTTHKLFNDSSALWTVPNGCKYIYAKVWGSGGEPDAVQNGLPGGDGGAGGYSEAVIPVTAGEQLYVGVGRARLNATTHSNGEPPNNGGGSSTFGFGGGFSGVFRASVNTTWGANPSYPTPLIIAGGGGCGQVNNTNRGGAGGGLTGQSGDGGVLGGTQTGNGTNNNTGTIGGPSSSGHGGGYYGGGFSGNVGSGGSGYIGANNNLHATTTAGNFRTPPQTSNADYLSSIMPGGYSVGYGGVGNDNNDYRHGHGAVVIHALGGGYDPASLPTIPSPRTIIAVY